MDFGNNTACVQCLPSEHAEVPLNEPAGHNGYSTLWLQHCLDISQ